MSTFGFFLTTVTSAVKEIGINKATIFPKKPSDETEKPTISNIPLNARTIEINV